MNKYSHLYLTDILLNGRANQVSDIFPLYPQKLLLHGSIYGGIVLLLSFFLFLIFSEITLQINLR